MGYLHKTIVAEHLQAFKVMHLDGSTSFLSASFEDICAAYNGIGPDRLPWWARGIVTLCARIFAPAALEHDFEYEKSMQQCVEIAANPPSENDIDMLRNWMHSDNVRLYDNCCTIARYRFGILNPLRYFWLAVARLFLILCERYGLRGLIDGVKARQRIRSDARAMVSGVFGGEK